MSAGRISPSSSSGSILFGSGAGNDEPPVGARWIAPWGNNVKDCVVPQFELPGRSRIDQTGLHWAG
jgi:hypothetical protein